MGFSVQEGYEKFGKQISPNKKSCINSHEHTVSLMILEGIYLSLKPNLMCLNLHLSG